MIPTRPLRSRYAATARRTLARRAALAALIMVPGVACGNNDAEVFSSATTQNPSSTVDGSDTTSSAPTATDPAVADDAANGTTTGAGTTADAATTIVEATTTTTATTEPVASSTTGGVFPASAELAVSFTFTATSSDGRSVENPYVAVWVEDLDGNLVQTISVWYDNFRNGAKYLADLPQWFSASGQANDLTMSGATQVAGEYTVAWDGTDLDGRPVELGEYVVYVEAAREHGPYEITSQQITIGAEPFTIDLPADGELSNVSASLIA